MSDSESWEAWHRNQIKDILNLVAATERQAGENSGIEPLQFERVVTKGSGEPGAGFHKTVSVR
jgi:hypothetical protein